MTSTVLMTITADDIEQHRDALCRWAKANGLDPNNIASAPGLTIERSGKGRSIVWHEFQRDDQGRIMPDPADPTVVWTVRKATRMISLPGDHGYVIKPKDHNGE